MTSAEVGALRARLDKSHSTKTLAKLLRLYKAACAEGEGTEGAGAIADAKAYNALMVTTLQVVHRELQHHLGDRNPSVLAKGKELKRLRPLAASFLKSTLGECSDNARPARSAPRTGAGKRGRRRAAGALLCPLRAMHAFPAAGLLEDMSEMSLVAFILRELEPYVKFLVALPKVMRRAWPGRCLLTLAKPARPHAALSWLGACHITRRSRGGTSRPFYIFGARVRARTQPGTGSRSWPSCGSARCPSCSRFLS